MAVGGLSTVGGIEYEAKITPIVVISCIMAATGGLMFGYDIGISGGVTSMPDFLKKFFPVVYKRIQEKGLDSNYCKYDNEGLQMFTSSLYLAALIATFGASYTTRSLGRRLTMLIAGIFFIIGTILNAAAINFLMLVLGRLMLGCGVGFANQVNPEASTPIYSLRGLDNFKFFSLSFYWYWEEEGKPITSPSHRVSNIFKSIYLFSVLSKRMCINDTHCHVCSGDEELMEHLFLHCNVRVGMKDMCIMVVARNHFGVVVWATSKRLCFPNLLCGETTTCFLALTL